MSDYQFVHFLACDAPLSKEQIAFMRKQSKTARITEWEFIDEYRGEFNGGNFFNGHRWGMLQQGYDAYLDYISIGIRGLEFRFPGGLPGDQKMMKMFEFTCGPEWRPDHDHIGPLTDDDWTAPGILVLDAKEEGNEKFNKEPLDPAPLLRQIAPLRRTIAAGDLRPLYLSWLAGYYDRKFEDELEPPVPAGLRSLTPPLQALAQFLGLAPELIAAAAERSPELPAVPALLEQGMSGMPWPVAEPAPTMTQLRIAAASLSSENRRRAAPSPATNGRRQ